MGTTIANAVMDMAKHPGVFLRPTHPKLRQYEALRARHVERCSTREAAERFGYNHSYFRNLCADFLANPRSSFFLPEPETAEAPEPTRSRRAERDRRILELRDERRLSVGDIARILGQEGIGACASTVAAVLRRAGRGRLARRPERVLAEIAGPEAADVADARRLRLEPRRFRTDCGGLFLFLPLLERIGLDRLAGVRAMPGSEMIPAASALRSLLALKLWGRGRPVRVMTEVLDEGLALFAGLNAVPKRSSLSEYSCRVDPRILPALMDDWAQAVHEAGLPRADSFDLDFHTIPCHGDDAMAERHCVSKRSRRQKGILAFIARDDLAGAFCYADATVRKASRNGAIIRFAELWRERTGVWPGELVFDSRPATCANLGRLDELGIRFITLRRRGAGLLRRLEERPADDWTRIGLSNVGRKYRTPRILDDRVRLRGCEGELRQIAIADLGRDRPTLLITNQLEERPADLIDRYARRMVIENGISEAVQQFHMDALSAAVPMKVDVDLNLTVMAAGLYRLLAERIGQDCQRQKAATLFQKFVKASAEISVDEREIVVGLGRRSHNPVLVKAGIGEDSCRIPWLGDRTLRFRFGENGGQNVT